VSETNLITDHKLLLVTALLALLIAGCASGLSKDECQLADWYAIGYEDGVQGRPESRIGEHRKACANHGVAFNFDNYHSGWEAGVTRYCQPGNGYRLGRSGNRYAGICPDALEAEFLHAYGHGRELYDLEAELQHTERTLNYKRKRLSHIEKEMRDTGIELVTKGGTTEQRVVLVDELRKLEDERATTVTEIPALEAELESQRERLAIVRGEHEY